MDLSARILEGQFANFDEGLEKQSCPRCCVIPVLFYLFQSYNNLETQPIGVNNFFLLTFGNRLVAGTSPREIKNRTCRKAAICGSQPGDHGGNFINLAKPFHR